MIRRICLGIAMGTLLGAVASCAEPRPHGKISAAPANTSGTHFEGTGRVTMHRGQPCASQIMFDFDYGFGRKVSLAAGAKDSSVLTAAAQHRQRLHVSGTWRHGQEKNCRYVSVTTVWR